MKPVTALFAVTILACLFSFRASAATAEISINLASLHTQQWARRNLNQSNPGIGFAYHFNKNWAIAAGGYFNSYRRTTVYGLAEWTPLHFGLKNWQFSFGGVAGLASGYRQNEVPISPLIGAGLVRIVSSLGLSASIFAVPNTGAHSSGFIGLQIGIPLSFRQQQ